MKKNTNYYKYILPVGLIVLYLCACGCTKNIDAPKKFSPPLKPGTLDLPQRLISDYEGMQEDDTVAWVWLRKGFRMEKCKNIKIHPLKNFSLFDSPTAEAEVEKSLQEIFKASKSIENGDIDVGIMAAIVDMKPHKGFLERFSSSIDSTYFIEIEIVVVEEKSKTVLLKLCHFKKAEDFNFAIKGLIQDLKIFFAKKI